MFIRLLLLLILSISLLGKELPPGSKISQKANVLFVIDDSGSMDWCDIGNRVCYDGWGGNNNYSNYPYEACQCKDGAGNHYDRMSLTKDALKDIFNDTTINFGDIRIGIAGFPGNSSPMIHVPVRNGDENAGQTDSQLNKLINAVNNNINAGGGTPIMNTLNKSLNYFQNNIDSSICNNCTSPIISKCQKNYLILFTDGAPSYYSKSDIKTRTAELAKEGLSGFQVPGTSEVMYYPGVTTIPIGFGGSVNVSYLAEGSLNGNNSISDAQARLDGAGEQYQANNKAEVKQAFKDIISKIATPDITSAVPTLVPSFNPQEEDVIYQSIFKPLETGELWEGRFYKYELDSSGFPKTTPEWEVSQEFPASPDSRKIYTGCQDISEFKAEHVDTLAACMVEYSQLSHSTPSDPPLVDTGWAPCSNCSNIVDYEIVGLSMVGDTQDLQLYFENPQFQSIESNNGMNDGILFMTTDSTPEFYLLGGSDNTLYSCGTTMPEVTPRVCNSDSDCTNTACLKTYTAGIFTLNVTSFFDNFPSGYTGVCASISGSCSTHDDCTGSQTYCGKDFYPALTQCVHLDGIEKVYTTDCNQIAQLTDQTNNNTTYKFHQFSGMDQIKATYFANSNTSTGFTSLKYRVKEPVTSTSSPKTIGEYRKLIRYIRGYDAYKSASCSGAESETLGSCDKRHMLADIYNSRAKYFGVPHQNYSYASYKTFKTGKSARKGKELLFVGSNEGMLHAFATATGKELFAFIPPNALPLIRNHLKESASKPTSIFLLDGTPKIMDVYTGGAWKTILLQGFGEGGQGMFALDITDIHAGTTTQPEFLWAIYNNTSAFNSNTTKHIFHWYRSGTEVKMNLYAEGLSASQQSGNELPVPANYDYSHLDLTWSEPVIAQIGSNDTTPGTFYAVFGAGGTNSSHSGQGNRHFGGAVYMVDPLTGKIAKQFTITDPAHRNVAPRFAGVPAILPDFQLAQNREMHSIYMADLSGAIWRMDPHATASGGLIDCPGSGCIKLFDFESTKQKKNYIYHSIAMSYDGNPGEGESNTNLWLYLGTGDHSMAGIKDNDAGDNYLVAVKDPTWRSKSSTATIELGDLTKISANNTAISATSSGWYYELFTGSEKLKLVADPTIIDGYVYFTAYRPTTTATSVCDAGTLGQSYLYSFDLFDATYNPDFKDLNNDAATPAPRGLLGTGIATAPVLKGNAMYFGISGEAVSSEKPIFDQGERRKNLIKWERTNATSSKKTVVPFNYFREIF